MHHQIIRVNWVVHWHTILQFESLQRFINVLLLVKLDLTVVIVLDVRAKDVRTLFTTRNLVLARQLPLEDVNLRKVFTRDCTIVHPNPESCASSVVDARILHAAFPPLFL